MKYFGFKTWQCGEANLFAALIVCFFFTACHKAQTPQAQIRKTIEQAESAVAAKDVAALRAMVSEKYSDADGRDKKAVESVLRAYFLRHQSINLFTRVRKIDVVDDTHLQVTVSVAVASQPVKSAQELEALRADLYQFQVTFVHEGEQWRALKTEWRPAELIDFI